MAKAETLEWIEYSKRDFDSASFLKAMKPLPVEIICYLSQQAAEKALKALLVENSIPVQKTHDLLILQKLLNPILGTNQIDSQCALLTNFATITRYPYPSIQIEESESYNALEASKKVRDFVKNCLELESSKDDIILPSSTEEIDDSK